MPAPGAPNPSGPRHIPPLHGAPQRRLCYPISPTSEIVADHHISGGAGRYRCPVSPGWEWESAGGAGEEGGDDLGGVAVEGLAGSVVAHRGACVGVAGCLLYVPQRDAGVQGGAGEGLFGPWPRSVDVDVDHRRLHVMLRGGHPYGTDVSTLRWNGVMIGPFGSTTSAKMLWNFSSAGKESSHLPQSLKLAKSQ
jgi:hypothetical protein